MNFIITKEIPFEAGHRLINYEGKCKNLHGHNYIATIGIASKELSPTGFVQDFGEVKAIIKKWLDENIDHGMMLNINDPLCDVLEKHRQKLYYFAENPTAEVMAHHFCQTWQLMIPNLLFVEITETPTCKARFEL